MSLGKSLGFSGAGGTWGRPEVRSGSELRSGRNLEFGVDVSRVKLDGPEAHREPFGGLPVVKSGSDELCDRRFGRGELARPRPPLARPPMRASWRSALSRYGWAPIL